MRSAVVKMTNSKPVYTMVPAHNTAWLISKVIACWRISTQHLLWVECLQRQSFHRGYV